MSDYIIREEFIADKRKQYCENCDHRKGMKNGKLRICYEIGGAACKACGINDMLNDIEDYPAADVRENKRGKWIEHGEPNERMISETWYWACDNCGAVGLNDSNYCHNCGAYLLKVKVWAWIVGALAAYGLVSGAVKFCLWLQKEHEAEAMEPLGFWE